MIAVDKTTGGEDAKASWIKMLGWVAMVVKLIRSVEEFARRA